jgi:hypothetical protein
MAILRPGPKAEGIEGTDPIEVLAVFEVKTGGIAAPGARGATDRGPFPDPPSSALLPCAVLAVEGTRSATKGVAFPDPPSDGPVQKPSSERTTPTGGATASPGGPRPGAKRTHRAASHWHVEGLQ